MRAFQTEDLGQPTSDREKRWREYLGQIVGGDAQSLARLYEECAAALFGLALKTMKNEADAEEIILEVFEQVWRTASSFDAARGGVWRWLVLIARSRALDRLRSAAAKRDRQHQPMPEDWDPASQDPLPDHATIFDQERRLIQVALQSLPGEQRQAVELAYFSGLTHVEIARELGVPLGTIKSRIRGAMEKLRASLAQGGRAGEELVQ